MPLNSEEASLPGTAVSPPLVPVATSLPPSPTEGIHPALPRGRVMASPEAAAEQDKAGSRQDPPPPPSLLLDR